MINDIQAAGEENVHICHKCQIWHNKRTRKTRKIQAPRDAVRYIFADISMKNEKFLKSKHSGANIEHIYRAACAKRIMISNENAIQKD